MARVNSYINMIGKICLKDKFVKFDVLHLFNNFYCNGSFVQYMFPQRGGKRAGAVSSLGLSNSNRNDAVQNVFHKLVQDRKIFNIQLEMTIL